MAKTRGKSQRKSTYTRAPQVEEAKILERYMIAVQVMNGDLTIAKASRLLGLTRVQTQTLVHRAQAATITSLMPQSRGRPRKATEVRQLEQQNRQLRRELELTQKQLTQKNALLRTASEVLRDQACTEHRPRGRRATSSTRRRPEPEAPDDIEPPDRRLARADDLRRAGVSGALASAIVGVGTSTLRRWRARQRVGEPTRARRGPSSDRHTPDPAVSARAVALVRTLRGGIGVESLRHAVSGLSRRQAADIKADTVRTMERERKTRATRVSVTAPGVVRGFDAMYLETLYGRQYLLEAIDANVPYRTSLEPVERYDGDSVAVMLERDFCQHGAPLVLRLDRARAHRATVLELCEHFGVVMLHGPPHLARFYGQLERQNREHRDWLETLEISCPAELIHELERMRTRLNDLKPRRSLGWDTASTRWKHRREFGSRNASERRKFRCDVASLSERILVRLRDGEPYNGFAHALAVQTALIQRGLLRLSRTGEC